MGIGCPLAIETLARICPCVSFIVRVHVHDGRVAFYIFKYIFIKNKFQND